MSIRGKDMVDLRGQYLINIDDPDMRNGRSEKRMIPG